MPVIKTNEATVKTCMIEIKALTVSKRQVTMGLLLALDLLEQGDVTVVPHGAEPARWTNEDAEHWD
jgi:hypothetical protein